MVNAGFFRAAGAYLAMCPAVICGGEGGEGSVLMRVRKAFLFQGRDKTFFCGGIKGKKILFYDGGGAFLSE